MYFVREWYWKWKNRSEDRQLFLDDSKTMTERYAEFYENEKPALKEKISKL